jgi:hypothetical protein
MKLFGHIFILVFVALPLVTPVYAEQQDPAFSEKGEIETRWPGCAEITCDCACNASIANPHSGGGQPRPQVVSAAVKVPPICVPYSCQGIYGGQGCQLTNGFGIVFNGTIKCS